MNHTKIKDIIYQEPLIIVFILIIETHCSCDLNEAVRCCRRPAGGSRDSPNWQNEAPQQNMFNTFQCENAPNLQFRGLKSKTESSNRFSDAERNRNKKRRCGLISRASCLCGNCQNGKLERKKNLNDGNRSTERDKKQKCDRNSVWSEIKV